MVRVNVKGSALEYPEAGSGTPIVLVHGSASDHRTWHLQPETFAEHFCAISLEQAPFLKRGHSLSQAVRFLRLAQDASRTRP